MPYRAVLLLIALAAACGSPLPSGAGAPGPSPSSTPAAATGPIEACGTVRAWAPPSETAAGSVTLGTRTYTVGAGTRHGATGFVPTVGQDMCLFGGLDGDSAVSHGATALDRPFCGKLVAFTGPAAQQPGSLTLLHFAFATLPIPPGTDLGTPLVGARRCFDVAVDAAGDPSVMARRSDPRFELETLWCGRVTAYGPATATEPGRLTIGTRSWSIAPGIAHDTEYPKYRGDQTELGQARCLTGAVDDAGRLVRYLTSEMPSREGGLVTAYTPATADRPGALTFSLRYERIVAAGAALEGVKLGAQLCVAEDLDAGGDRVVTGTFVCEPARVGRATPALEATGRS